MRNNSLTSAAIFAALVASTVACVQSASRPSDAALTITAADVKRRVSIIADDSMRGRETPSPGLEKTARYIASEFGRFGLVPLGHGGFVQRYEIAMREVIPSRSRLLMRNGDALVRVSFSRDARHVAGGYAATTDAGSAVVVAGPVSLASPSPDSLIGKLVLYVADMRHERVAAGDAVERLARARPAAIVVISNRDATQFTERIEEQRTPRLVIGPTAGSPDRDTPIIEVREHALKNILAPLGIDAAALRRKRMSVVRQLRSLSATIGVATRESRVQSAPNVVGMVEGSDPVLKHEYVVFSAHMDHVGVQAPRAGSRDSIWNGADDDASGTAGVMELAEAFSRGGARPRRSLIFLTVSGEEKGLWGSDYFASHPPVPISQIVADLNIDMIGRNWRDTIVAIGKEHSDLGATLERVGAAHPELRMHAIDDPWPQESFYTRSDHFNFARRGVPILFFFNGTHEDYHEASDSPDKIDAEKESRIGRLVYYLGEAIANATERPRWREGSYRKIVGER